MSFPRSTNTPYASMFETVTVIVSPSSNSSSTSARGSERTALIDNERCLLSLSYEIAFTVTVSPSL